MVKHEICDSGHEDTKAKENDVDTLWRELQQLGSLPVNKKDEDAKEVTESSQNNPFENNLSSLQERSKETQASINIPIKREEKARDTNNSDGDGGFGLLDKFTPVINLNTQETNIETEKSLKIKPLKSCLKSDNKTKVPITIKIPIRHEKSPIAPKTADKNADCPVGGQCQGHAGDVGDGTLHSVSTQTDKNGCNLM